MKRTLLIVFALVSVLSYGQENGNSTKEPEVREINLNETEKIKDVPFAIIEDVPVFPGCESESNSKDKKICINRMMRKHIITHFDVDLVNCLETEMVYNKEKNIDEEKCKPVLSRGKKVIYIQFKIDQYGEVVDITVRAPHPRLEDEGRRIAELLPKMIPGRLKGKPVKVGYTLPITFNVR